MDQSASLTQEQQTTREKVLSCLIIDCFMRKADYAKFYTDIDMATEDYQNAIKICEKFTSGNERIMSSAYFSLGSLHLDKADRATAKLNFDHAIKITQNILIKYLKEKG